MEKHTICKSQLVTALEVAEREFQTAAETSCNDRVRQQFENQTEECRKALEALSEGRQLHVED